MMKRVREIITTDNSFFETMLDEHGSLYGALFNDYVSNTEPHELDMMLLVNCGERYAAPLLIHHDMSEVVNYVVKKYGNNWERILATLETVYDPLKPYNVESVTTGKKVAKHDTTSESQDKTGIVGFDSETPADSTVDTNNNTVNIAQDETTDTTVRNSGNNGNLPISSLIQSEIELRKKSFINLVINDIQSQITLDIY